MSQTAARGAATNVYLSSAYAYYLWEIKSMRSAFEMPVNSADINKLITPLDVGIRALGKHRIRNCSSHISYPYLSMHRGVCTAEMVYYNIT